MRRLHLSALSYLALGDYPGPPPPDDQIRPACGADDGVAVIRRGVGTGLVRQAAVSSEFHCPACVAAVHADRPYEVRCAAVRSRRAIGTFEPIEVEILSPSPRSALAAFRAAYETAGPPVVVVDRWTGETYTEGVGDDKA
jgi:hypothetical protein